VVSGVLLTSTISRLIAGRAFKQVLAVLLVIEGVSLAESLGGLVEDVVGNDGTFLDVAKLLFLGLPEIFDFALPLALVVGIYVALVSAREDNELVVCSAAGMSANRISGSILSLGVIGFAASLLVAGFVNPIAVTIEHAMLWDLQSRLVVKRIVDPEGREGLQTIDDWTFISTGANTGDRERGHLFVHRPLGDGGWRVTQADDWTLAGPDRTGRYVVNFKTVIDYQSRNLGYANPEDEKRARPTVAASTEPENLEPRFSAVRADNITVPVNLDSLMRRAEEARGVSELTLTETMAAVAAGTELGTSDDAKKRAGQLIGRALLCIIACLFALSALIVARAGVTRYVALPGAVVATLGIDVASRTLLGEAAQAGLVDLLIAAGALFATCALPLGLLILWKGQRLIAPAYGRA